MEALGEEREREGEREREIPWVGARFAHNLCTGVDFLRMFYSTCGCVYVCACQRETERDGEIERGGVREVAGERWIERAWV